MKYVFGIVLVFISFINSAFSGEKVVYYPYKDTKFDKAVFDTQFFSDILLEKDSANIPKYEEERNELEAILATIQLK